MKILILANNAAGLFAFRKEIIVELLKNSQVYVSTPQGLDTEKLIVLGCIFIETNFDRHSTNPMSDIKLLKEYLNIIDRVHPDVVLTYTIKPNIYGGIASGIKKIPYITNITGLGVTLENPGLIGKIVRKLYKIGLKKSSVVFFQNSANRDFMIKNKIVKGKNYLLPGSGINLQENQFEDYPEQGSDIIFLIIGRIMKDKGIDEVLQAIKIVKKRNPNLIFKLIGGYDEDYKLIVEEAERHKLLTYVGYVDNVHDYLRESHATINASYHEGMSNVLLETAATGRPILASDIPGCRETVIKDKSGFLFRVKDVNDIVATIERFLSLPYEEKANMGKRGRKLMEKRFDRKYVVEKYMKEIHSSIYTHKLEGRHESI